MTAGLLVFIARNRTDLAPSASLLVFILASEMQQGLAPPPCFPTRQLLLAPGSLVVKAAQAKFVCLSASAEPASLCYRTYIDQNVTQVTRLGLWSLQSREGAPDGTST